MPRLRPTGLGNLGRSNAGGAQPLRSMKRSLGILTVLAALVATVAVLRLGTGPSGVVPVVPPQQPPPPPNAPADSTVPSPAAHPLNPIPSDQSAQVESPPPPPASVSLNKADRLAQLRDTFRAMAKGDPVAALRSAKRITDDTERETALLELVTQWRKGELANSRERAQAIASYGLEAGLGFELTKDPQLALAWADELTEGPGRAALLQQTAVAMVEGDPTSAFALSDRLDPSERRGFFDAVFAGWAGKDTDSALQFAEQLPDAERDPALQAIRSVAPVGIGTQIGVQNGYAIIQGLLPGAPAEQSGQLGPGDRILAIAQGDNAFVDARGMPLKDLVDRIRGAPGTLVQLQVLSSEAGPDATPRTVSIVRGQIKFKQ